MADGDDKTEQATPRRRGDARKKGQVAKSVELSSVVVLLAMIVAVNKLSGAMSHVVLEYFQNAFTHLDNLAMTPAIAMERGGAVALTLARALGPLLLVAMFFGVLVNIAQTGPMWAPEALKPDFNRINPLKGIQGFITPMAFVDLIKSFYKVFLVGYIAYVTVRGSFPQLVLMARLDISQAVGIIGEVVYRMAMRIGGAMLIMAALDYAFQRYSHEKSLRMTKHDVKQEFKQMEGSPMLKARIRSRQRQIARQRMMAEVPTADVVVTNPTHFAVALRYDLEKNAAPVVVAKGQDLVALRIRELAQSSDVPIVENPPLARTLYKQVDIGREIPGDLYEAVAEVLAFVYQVNQKRRERSGMASSMPQM